jgi:hypothetical protein
VVAERARPRRTVSRYRSVLWFAFGPSVPALTCYLLDRRRYDAASPGLAASPVGPKRVQSETRTPGRGYRDCVRRRDHGDRRCEAACGVAGAARASSWSDTRPPDSRTAETGTSTPDATAGALLRRRGPNVARSRQRHVRRVLVGGALSVDGFRRTIRARRGRRPTWRRPSTTVDRSDTRRHALAVVRASVRAASTEVGDAVGVAGCASPVPSVGVSHRPHSPGVERQGEISPEDRRPHHVYGLACQSSARLARAPPYIPTTDAPLLTEYVIA